MGVGDCVGRHRFVPSEGAAESLLGGGTRRLDPSTKLRVNPEQASCEVTEGSRRLDTRPPVIRFLSEV
jgi:hypothetical protein